VLFIHQLVQKGEQALGGSFGKLAVHHPAEVLSPAALDLNLDPVNDVPVFGPAAIGNADLEDDASLEGLKKPQAQTLAAKVVYLGVGGILLESGIGQENIQGAGIGAGHLMRERAAARGAILGWRLHWHGHLLTFFMMGQRARYLPSLQATEVAGQSAHEKSFLGNLAGAQKREKAPIQENEKNLALFQNRHHNTVAAHEGGIFPSGPCRPIPGQDLVPD
jgi:hypothetical protein